MTQLDNKRKALYDKLISLNYFKEDDGTIYLSFDEFQENLNDADNIGVFYDNLAEDGVMNDANGNLAIQKDEFIAEFGGLQAPSTPVEKFIFDKVAELVNTTEFGINSNIFSVGITSLTAMRLSAAILQKYAVKITVNEIGKNASVADLAKIVEAGIKPVNARKGNPLF